MEKTSVPGGLTLTLLKGGAIMSPESSNGFSVLTIC